MTKLWKHMSETHGISLLESEEHDIVNAAKEDAELTRRNLINQLIEAQAIIAEHERDVKMLCEMLGTKTIAEGIERLKNPSIADCWVDK